TPRRQYHDRLLFQPVRAVLSRADDLEAVKPEASMKPLLALVAMLAATAWSQPREFVELGRKALATARAGRYQEAMAADEQMLKIDPGNQGVRYDLALALNQLGRNRESLAALGKPAGADALALAGLNYRALGDLVSAERDLRAAFALEPGPQVAADLGIV